MSTSPIFRYPLPTRIAYFPHAIRIPSALRLLALLSATSTVDGLRMGLTARLKGLRTCVCGI